MIKIVSPSNFSSFDTQAVFRFTSDVTADAGAAVEALLEDADTGGVIAARRLRLDSSAAAVFDVAPILRRAMELRPAAGATGLAAADDAMFRVRMRVGMTVSDAVTLLCSQPVTNSLACLTAMPVRRTIRRGDCDRLLFYAMADFAVDIEAGRDNGTADSAVYEWSGDGGLVVLRLRAADFGGDVRRLTVRTGSRVVAEYEVEEPTAGSMRLAWRTSLGSVEHYTFPVVVRREVVSGNRTVRLADGTCTLSGDAHAEIVLRSHREPSAVVDALAGIVASPQVWLTDEATGDYLSVTVETRQAATRSFGEPSNVELTVRPSQNGVML